MKKLRVIIFTLSALLILNSARSQGWTQYNNAIYSVGIGGTDVIGLNTAYPAFYGGGTSINFSGEYKVQRFVGIGFETGLDVLSGPRYYRNDLPPYPAYTALGIPAGFKVNFHILDAANSPRAGRGDIYIGLNVGGGLAFYTSAPPAGGNMFGFLFGGPQFGGRYWFNQNIGLFGEIGWGATFANVGLTF